MECMYIYIHTHIILYSIILYCTILYCSLACYTRLYCLDISITCFKDQVMLRFDLFMSFYVCTFSYPMSSWNNAVSYCNIVSHDATLWGCICFIWSYMTFCLSRPIVSYYILSHRIFVVWYCSIACIASLCLIQDIANRHDMIWHDTISSAPLYDVNHEMKWCDTVERFYDENWFNVIKHDMTGQGKIWSVTARYHLWIENRTHFNDVMHYNVVCETCCTMM